MGPFRTSLHRGRAPRLHPRSVKLHRTPPLRSAVVPGEGHFEARSWANVMRRRVRADGAVQCGRGRCRRALSDPGRGGPLSYTTLKMTGRKAAKRQWATRAAARAAGEPRPSTGRPACRRRPPLRCGGRAPSFDCRRLRLVGRQRYAMDAAPCAAFRAGALARAPVGRRPLFYRGIAAANGARAAPSSASTGSGLYGLYGSCGRRGVGTKISNYT